MEHNNQNALKNVRVICHVDLDAFYAQVEQQANAALQRTPVAVVQYNPFGDLKSFSERDDRIFNDSNGSIIAVSYGEARRSGVKRQMRGSEARALCPSLQLVQVPTSNGKADLTLYRRHGEQVLAILAEDDAAGTWLCQLCCTHGGLQRH
jgi:DNA polymerase eta